MDVNKINNLYNKVKYVIIVDFKPYLLCCRLESTDLSDLLAPLLPDHTEKCDADSCIPMGLDTPNYPARGVFVIETPLDAPFCGWYKIKGPCVFGLSGGIKVRY